MIKDGTTECKYIETSDNTLCDLKRFQGFLYSHLYKHKDCEAMHPRSNQPGLFSLQLRLLSLNPLWIFIWKVSSYVL